MKYLKPVNFYKEIFKEILMKKDSKHGRLLGLDVSDKFVSLAVSDWKNLTAVPLRALDRQENNLSSMVADIFQSLIPEHNLVGFVVGTNKYAFPIDAQTHVFIDDLRKTGKVEGLKYTVWDHGIRSKNAEFVLKQHLEFLLENMYQPQHMSKTIMEKCHSVSAPQNEEPVFEGQLESILEYWHQHLDMSKTIMEKCHAVCALQGYLDCTNKMLEEDWD